MKQRVSEAVDKIKRQSTEEKQRLVLEANAKLRESVSATRSEIEGRMAQAQALAVQEALKEANAQNSSKEVSAWSMFDLHSSLPNSTIVRVLLHCYLCAELLELWPSCH